jgi:hypothetical protein
VAATFAEYLRMRGWPQQVPGDYSVPEGRGGYLEQLAAEADEIAVLTEDPAAHELADLIVRASELTAR